MNSSNNSLNRLYSNNEDTFRWDLGIIGTGGGGGGGVGGNSGGGGVGGGGPNMDTTTIGSVTTTGTASSMNGVGMGSSTGGGGTSYSAGRSGSASGGSSVGGGAIGGNYREKSKIGHREIKDGVVHYKKVSTDELKKSIQFGIVHFINEQNRLNIDRDLLMQDFQVIETVVFPRYDFIKKFHLISIQVLSFSHFILSLFSLFLLMLCISFFFSSLFASRKKSGLFQYDPKPRLEDLSIYLYISAYKALILF